MNRQSHGPSDASNWSFHPPIGQMHEGPFRGEVDVTQPHHGLHRLQLGSEEWNGQLLGIVRQESPFSGEESLSKDTFPEPLQLVLKTEETYVRGHDLVAVYPPSPTWPYRSEIYWRINPAEAELQEAPLASLSLTVSAQTDLLDSCLCLSIASKLEAGELLRLTLADVRNVPVTKATVKNLTVESLTGQGKRTFSASTSPSCLLWRLAGGRVTYVEMVQSSDYQLLSVEHGANASGASRWDLFEDFLEKGVIRRARIHAAFLPRENDVNQAATWCQAWEASKLPLTT